MASTQVTMWLSVIVISQLMALKAQPESIGFIQSGSSLQSNTNHRYWLSPSGRFAFGFYPQGNKFAVGIWLLGTNRDDITVVWTANQDNPSVSSNSTIQFTRGGQLILQTDQYQETKNITETSAGVSAAMLDSGNFVIYNNFSEVIWESFSHPTDTLLDGQSLSKRTALTSSRSTSDYSSGRFQIQITTNGELAAYPVNHTGAVEEFYWRFVPNGGINRLNLTDGILLSTTGNRIANVTANVSYNAVENETVIHRATLDADGILRLYLHRFKTNGSSDVTIRWSALQNQCKVKGFCGFNSFCAIDSTLVDCFCFPGFDFINPLDRHLGCSSSFIDRQGCHRKEPSLFYDVNVLENTTLGGLPYAQLSLDKEACSKSCLQDCYCGAAYYMDGTCWKLKLPLMFAMKDENEPGTVFIKSFSGRSTPTVPEREREITEGKKKLITILAASLGSITFLCFLIAIYSILIYKFRVDKYRKLPANSNVGLTQEFTVQSFSYNELWQATDGFKERLGRGSFGTVYKGSISDGQKLVAVKRLENPEEEVQRKFRTELAIVRQTHHRNVVRLLGFCLEGSRKLLVYEYMSRGSLANLLFNVEKRPLWKERVRISLDVAKAIFYLHEECEVQIIHCDIKPKNILLDESGTAKISNFGFANLLMPNQTETISGIEGTKGYMAPERQKNAFITTRSDVFSFGVVILEIICCRSNIEVNAATADEILLSTWVYKCFVAGELNKLVQDEEVDARSLERMVKVGLLCVQDDQSLRPSMKSVILMLEGTMDVPSPPFPTTLVAT